MQRHIWLLLAITAAYPMGQVLAQARMDTLALRAHTHFLAHDLLQGRATGTAGAELAAQYIADQCRALGLLPASTGYLQAVGLEQSTVRSGTALRLLQGTLGTRFTFPTDFTPDVGNRESFVDFSGPAFYLGPAGELRVETLRDLDLNGAVAVVAGARVTVPVAEALRQMGAVGLIHLLGDPGVFDRYRSSRGPTRLYHSDSTVRSSFLAPLPSILAGPRLSYQLVSGTGLARGEPIDPTTLDRVISLEIQQERRAINASNVVCLYPGRDMLAQDSAIVFTAHYDHLGVGEPDASGDSIYNGFSDNAAGVAMLLAIAKAMVTERNFRHPVLFVFLVGEEKGLLGADYYVHDPVWPLDRTKAVINLDAGAPPGLQVSWRLAGVDSTGLGDLAIAVATERGWTITTSPPRANSDYYPFIREGVPAVFVIPGPEPFEGLSADSTAALRKRWDYYHRPGDHWTEDFPFAGVARYAEYGYLIAQAVDTATTPLTRPERR
ncbi:MAG: M28 family peptidase [Gemmatimonadota bacterium]|nr:MAG: M28 family peptidase [Gemmatimonadota bacterium]